MLQEDQEKQKGLKSKGAVPFKTYQGFYKANGGEVQYRQYPLKKRMAKED